MIAARWAQGATGPGQLFMQTRLGTPVMRPLTTLTTLTTLMTNMRLTSLPLLDSWPQKTGAGESASCLLQRSVLNNQSLGNKNYIILHWKLDNSYYQALSYYYSLVIWLMFLRWMILLQPRLISSLLFLIRANDEENMNFKCIYAKSLSSLSLIDFILNAFYRGMLNVMSTV